MPEPRETASMRPEDVPDELVPWLVGDDMPSEAVIRALLATVLPAHEAMVRAKAADAIAEGVDRIGIRIDVDELAELQDFVRGDGHA